MTITLPDELAARAEAIATARGFLSLTEYVSFLVEMDLADVDTPRLSATVSPEMVERLDRMIDESLTGGPAEPVTPEFWAALDRRIVDRATAQKVSS